MKWAKERNSFIPLQMKRTASCLAALCLTVLLTIFASPVSGDDGDTELAAGNEAYEAQSYESAIKHFRKAAEKGNAEAQFKLGYCLYQGLGAEQDQAEAVKWFRKAAEQGLAEAQYSLGVCYAKGIGVKKNRAESRKWYRKAAEQGVPEAQKALGEPLSANMFRLRLIFHLAVGVFLLVLLVKSLGKLVRRHPRDVDDVDPDAPPARADLRWGARLIDLFFETAIVNILGGYVFLSLGMSSFWEEYLASSKLWAEEDSITSFVFSCCLIVLFAFILDSVINWAFGGTLGKWLFGIKIMRNDHNPLSFKDSFVRDIRVFWGGMASGIPFLNVITMYIQYHRVSNGLQATYDESLNMDAVEYHASHLKTFFGFLVFILMIGAGIVVSKIGDLLFSFPAWK